MQTINKLHILFELRSAIKVIKEIQSNSQYPLSKKHHLVLDSLNTQTLDDLTSEAIEQVLQEVAEKGVT
jgi:hypothetical protein